MAPGRIAQSLETQHPFGDSTASQLAEVRNKGISASLRGNTLTSWSDFLRAEENQSLAVPVSIRFAVVRQDVESR